MSDNKNSVRQIVFDTETTGLSPAEGHRVIELAAVELIDLIPTGREFYCLIDPERSVPEEVVAIHGITREMLLGKPKFKAIIHEFLEFIGNSPLVAHNANFDMGFINAELERLHMPSLANEYIDTVAISKRKFPGAHATLDALCRRFKINNSAREKHSALLDTKLLAEVYLQLNGGRARGFNFNAGAEPVFYNSNIRYREPREIGLASEVECQTHRDFVKGLKAAVWQFEEPEQSLAPSR